MKLCLVLLYDVATDIGVNKSKVLFILIIPDDIFLVIWSILFVRLACVKCSFRNIYLCVYILRISTNAIIIYYDSVIIKLIFVLFRKPFHD